MHHRSNLDSFLYADSTTATATSTTSTNVDATAATITNTVLPWKHTIMKFSHCVMIFTMPSCIRACKHTIEQWYHRAIVHEEA